MTTEVRRLLDRARPSASAPISAADLRGLPHPAARHLCLARAEGKRPPRTVHLLQSGEMKTAPDKRWMAFEAEQWFSLDPPGFIWYGSIRPAALIRIAGRDRFVDGRGSMQISVWGRIPVARVSGPESDRGELLRFLVETVWFPAFWRSPALRWQPIDENSARLSMRIGDVEVSSTILFGENGLACGIETERHRIVGKRFELTPWRCRCDGYSEENGVLVPHRVIVTWGLTQGDFEWLRAAVKRIDYA